MFDLFYSDRSECYTESRGRCLRKGLKKPEPWGSRGCPRPLEDTGAGSCPLTNPEGFALRVCSDPRVRCQGWNKPQNREKPKVVLPKGARGHTWSWGQPPPPPGPLQASTANLGMSWEHPGGADLYPNLCPGVPGSHTPQESPRCSQGNPRLWISIPALQEEGTPDPLPRWHWQGSPSVSVPGWQGPALDR